MILSGSSIPPAASTHTRLPASDTWHPGTPLLSELHSVVTLDGATSSSEHERLCAPTRRHRRPRRRTRRAHRRPRRASTLAARHDDHARHRYRTRRASTVRRAPRVRVQPRPASRPRGWRRRTGTDGLRRRRQWAQAADGRCAAERRPSSAAAAGSDRAAANASVPRRRPGADGAVPRSHRPPRQRRCHGPHGRRVGRLTRPRRRARLRSSTPSCALPTYTNAPHLVEASAAIANLRTAFLAGVRYLDGGWQTLVDQLLAKIRDAGITVRHEVAVSMRPVAGAHVVTTPSGQLHADASVLAIGSAASCAAVLGYMPAPWASLGPAAEVACLELGLRRPPTRRFALGIDEPLYFSTHCPPARLAPDGAAVVHLMRFGRSTTTRTRRSHDTAAVARPPHGGAGRGRRHRAVPARMVVPTAVPIARRAGLAGRPGRSRRSATGCSSPATGSAPRACSATLSQPVRWLPVGLSRRTCLRCWRCHDDDPRRSRRGGLLRPTRSVGRRRLPNHRLAEE